MLLHRQRVMAETVQQTEQGDDWGGCVADIVGDLFSDALEEYSDEAYLVHDLSTSLQSIPEESPVFVPDDAFAEEAVLEAEVGSVCSDYPDSESVKDSKESAPHFVQSQNSFFHDYVSDMVEAAFGGNVLEFFEAELSNLESQNLDAMMDMMPKASSLKPCSRPCFGKRLRPRELPPQAEEFPMDCLPSTPACASAPEGPSIEFFAYEMHHAARAEEAIDHALGEQAIEAALANAALAEEACKAAPQSLCFAPSPPSAPPQERKVQKTREDIQKAPLLPATPRTTNTPRIRRAGVGGLPSGTVPFSIVEPSIPMLPTAKTACSVPTPPSGPAPSGRASRSRAYVAASTSGVADKSGFEVTDKCVFEVMLKDGAKRPVISLQPPPQECTASLRKAINLETDRSNLAHAPASAMAMDLGEEAAARVPETCPANFASTGHYHTSFKKSMGILPAIFQSTGGGVVTPRGTWKAHDVVF